MKRGREEEALETLAQPSLPTSQPYVRPAYPVGFGGLTRGIFSIFSGLVVGLYGP